MASQMRVRRFKNSVVERGYTTPTITEYQVLEVKCWWGWKELDREEIPGASVIALGALGYDSANWCSKFASLGSFGPGGIITART